MSVLIEGMEMPKSCWECPLFDDKSMQCPILQCEIRTDQAMSASCCPLVPGEPQETVTSLMTTINKLAASIRDITENKDWVIVRTRCEECELDGTMDCMANYLANTPDECTKMGEVYDYSYCSWGVKREEKR